MFLYFVVKLISLFRLSHKLILSVVSVPARMQVPMNVMSVMDVSDSEVTACTLNILKNFHVSTLVNMSSPTTHTHTYAFQYTLDMDASPLFILLLFSAGGLCWCPGEV